MCSVVGVTPAFGSNYAHPLWADGTPILVGQDVKTPEGWVGFVGNVGHEEVAVYAYGDDDASSYDQFAPSDLRRYASAHIELDDLHNGAMTDNETLRQAIEVGENALTDAHAHAPLPEVAEWDALAEIVINALLRAGWALIPPGEAEQDGSEEWSYGCYDHHKADHSDGPGGADG